MLGFFHGISVFITSYLVKSLVHPVTFVFVYPLFSLIFTPIVYIASSLASFTIPVVTDIIMISEISISNIILLDVIIVAIGVVLEIIANLRYRKFINTSIKGISA